MRKKSLKIYFLNLKCLNHISSTIEKFCFHKNTTKYCVKGRREENGACCTRAQVLREAVRIIMPRDLKSRESVKISRLIRTSARIFGGRRGLVYSVTPG